VDEINFGRFIRVMCRYKTEDFLNLYFAVLLPYFMAFLLVTPV